MVTAPSLKRRNKHKHGFSLTWWTSQAFQHTSPPISLSLLPYNEENAMISCPMQISLHRHQCRLDCSRLWEMERSEVTNHITVLMPETMKATTMYSMSFYEQTTHCSETMVKMMNYFYQQPERQSTFHCQHLPRWQTFLKNGKSFSLKNIFMSTMDSDTYA